MAALILAEDNPFFKSFDSTMGEGLAGVINSLGVGYKLNEAMWEMDPGMRAPQMLEISIGFTPIHDIPPGLDSDGMNRAPIYKVGNSNTWGDVRPWSKGSAKARLTERNKAAAEAAAAAAESEGEDGDI
jgi:hypothetical protein